ncbi:hypothetical protein [Sphingomonas montana]|uniref:hypothetical protein n=1 Tax=Sphingomonas montana TaxID=1843236 RepID=UPI0009F9FBC3|nr:hypothetical protein [Sphingomonas montana]
MRISDAGLAVLLLLGACGQGSDDPRVVAGALDEDAAASGRIACRLGDAGAYRDACTAERTTTAAGQMLTLRGPDGGFHRILVAADGATVTAADGAEPATIAVGADGATEVAIGGDRYRLPAPAAARPAAAH